MRLLTWNIRAGGGKRIEGIAGAILRHDPDLIVLTEHRTASCAPLLERLAGYQAVHKQSEGAKNGVAVLCRQNLAVANLVREPESHHRWVCCSLPEWGVHLLGVHIPNQSEVWNKREFWDCVLEFANAATAERALIVGDLNTALDEDCQGDPIREATYLKQLLAMGWVDAWRDRNPDRSEHTWFSHKKNGFRLDYCLASPALAHTVTAAFHDHTVLGASLSDHSILVVDLD